MENLLSKLFLDWSGEEPNKIEQLFAHGSDRQYYRLYGPKQSAIGVYNHDKRENTAFLTLSDHFSNLNLPVPQVYAKDPENDVYLLQDLGDLTLFSFLSEVRKKDGFSDKIIEMYEKVMQKLPLFQIKGSKDLDYTICYPRHSFDKQSMNWDLNYFKYYFLKLAKIPFDEQKLENDFQVLTDYLLSTEVDFFLYRDFQSRNIMIVDDQPYFIDYQGGRKGALQYDVASLLYDAKADIPQEIRKHLIEKYIEVASKLTPLKKDTFMQYYHGYVLIRIMQALGAYGFRGFYERKTQFLDSVPYAIKNLEDLLHILDLPIEIPALMDAWSKLVRSTSLRQFGDAKLRLMVRIQSFSYKNGIPWDDKGHGGGFVFDCRSLSNPGRYPEYVELTGSDEKVISFFKEKDEVNPFMENIYHMTDQVINNYQNRNFTDLMIAFGCTGGQHRSVYCANLLYSYLKTRYNIDLELQHRELETDTDTK